MTACAAALALAGCHGLHRTEKARMTSARVEAENAVLIASRVPSSIVFRDEQVQLTDQGAVVCGEFNGRTRAGEMAGFTRFVFAKNELAVDHDKPAFAALWRQACASR